MTENIKNKYVSENKSMYTVECKQTIITTV